MFPSHFRKALLCASSAWVFVHAILTDAHAINRQVELGRRIYEQGILPDGSPLTTSTLSGSKAACVNCHRQSGYGSMEGRILIPPIAGAVLFAPGVFAQKSNSANAPEHSQVERFRARSAYDGKSLKRALHDGVDPDGVPFVPLMQRYPLNPEAISALSAYLRYLSDRPVPGIKNGTIHLGTVITPDVSLEHREAVLSVLRAFAKARGRWGMKWEVHLWQLAGGPQDWETQLKAYYRKQPVFALLSGAGRAEWLPIHRFCEHKAVACVLPSVEAAPEHDGSYYSLYFSPGLTLEARLLIRHLRTKQTALQRLIQVVDDDSGKYAATVVRNALADNKNITIQEMTPQEYAEAVVSEGDAVVLWLRPQPLRDLMTKIPSAIPADELFISSLLAEPDEISPPATWKDKLRYLSIFDPLAERRTQVTLGPWLDRQGIAETDLRIRADAYAACRFFNAALTEVQNQAAHGIRGPITGERVLETLESAMTVFRDDGAPFYWRMSLGNGQRFPIKGAMLLRYASPESNELVAAEERTVP